MYWIKVLVDLKDLYGKDSIVKESRARVIDWEAKKWVKRCAAPEGGEQIKKPVSTKK